MSEFSYHREIVLEKLPLIIDKLKIAKFRDIENLEFSFGSKITFIAGTNGTSKTSLLGLIGQPFVFREDKRVKHKTLIGKEFATKFSEIHNFTKFDAVEEIEYAIALTNTHGNKELPVKGYIRKGDESGAGTPRLVTGKTRLKGEGNYNLPVIYLGLKRLVPLGEHEESEIQINPIENMSEDDIKFFNEQHKKILLNLNDEFSLENVETPNKKMIGGRTEKYDSHGLSAGQDNVSQILTAILSFKSLKSELGSLYSGGILLIDEIEATLHPLAEEKLIECLYAYSSKLDLQIIVTTHSLEVLKLGIQTKYKDCTEIIYLTKSRGSLTYLPKYSFGEICADMTATPFKKAYPQTFAICEDDEAKTFLNTILPKNLKSRVNILSAKLSAGSLNHIAASKDLKKINKQTIYILDGDQKRFIRLKNVLILPGKCSPETLIWQLMNEMPPESSCWDQTKQVYMRDYANQPINREVYKDFFAYIKTVNSKAWAKFFKLWIDSNKESVDKFIKEFESTINKMESSVC